MDVDYFDSSAEAELEYLATMVMQMEKFPDFPSGALPPTSLTAFPQGAPPPPFVDQTLATSPASITSPAAAISFSGAELQGPAVPLSPVHHKLACDDVFPLRHRPAPTAAMREMMFRVAAMQPIHIDPETVRPPKRRNVRISKDPQSVAARHRRERISERIRILQRLVPGGTKMDTASMLDEAIHYVKFLKTQVQSLEMAAASRRAGAGLALSPPAVVSGGAGLSCFLGTAYEQEQHQFMSHHHNTWTLS